jgi:hypothetical protein
MIPNCRRRSRRRQASYTDTITGDDTHVETLRVRYAELLRLRSYVQRLEGLGQGTAGQKEHKARANIIIMERETAAAGRVLTQTRGG